MEMRKLKQGDRVVYRKTEHAVHPAPNATTVLPAVHGEDYAYFVKKYGVVEREVDEHTLEIRTLQGKRYQVRRTNPALRRIPLFNWLRPFNRFSRMRDLAGT